ncbi:hypothetical protein NONO_c08380 [Nocardia nova SH22a]|uniref:YtkA-like domain-containing protein n=1 Tax=Nocardia nova SH22a TaxID=1415166 RepID=W5T8I8_9NOCA|nr:hypothetical protein NONO_c08380 [Nocardia nova SH22a]
MNDRSDSRPTDSAKRRPTRPDSASRTVDGSAGTTRDAAVVHSISPTTSEGHVPEKDSIAANHTASSSAEVAGDAGIGEPVPGNSTTERNSPGGRSRNRRPRVAGALAVVAVLAAVVWWLWPEGNAPLVLHGGTPAHIVTVTLGDRVGSSDIGIELADRSGKPVSHAMIEVQAVEPRMGFAGEPVAAADHGAGSYHARDVGFMTTGPWQLRVSINTAGGAENLSLPLWIGG